MKLTVLTLFHAELGDEQKADLGLSAAPQGKAILGLSCHALGPRLDPWDHGETKA